MTYTQWETRRATLGNNSIRIILCDDDPAFLQALRAEIIRAFEKMNMNVTITASGRAADVTDAQFADCDMAFLDIDFEDEDYNGIDIARSLRLVNSRALVFFVTNFIDYAPAGYEVQAFRYILKRDITDVLERYILQAMEQFAQGQELLRLQARDETLDILLDEIAYLEVMGHSVSIHNGGRAYELSATLSGLEERLAGHGFLRIHKSYLVNMAHIRKFRSRECQLLDGTVLSVSEKNYAQQKQKYLLWKGLK